MDRLTADAIKRPVGSILISVPPLHRPSARTRILDVADRMFYEQGIRAVGVEAIVAAADTAKTTLYGQFGSKDGLIVAYLERRAAQERGRLDKALAALGGPAAGRVLHLYDLLAGELAQPGYRGSPFVNACVELGSNHPAAAVARGHRQWLLDTLTSLAVDTAAPAPAALAAQLLLLYEAATVATQIGGDGAAALAASTAAEALLSLPRPAPAGTQPLTTEHLAGTDTGDPLPSPTHRPGGSLEAHHLVAFLNSAHLPDGDDQLADERAGPWLAGWLADARCAAAAGLDAISPAPAELLHLREGLRQLAAVNCGAQADPHAVAQAAAVLEQTPLVVDLAGGAVPRLGAPDGADISRLAIAVAAGAYLALRARGEWPRLKVCASPDCRWAFLDTTRNRSRRWCDMAGCGNRAKNRAWRDRQEVVTVKTI
jgi:predicted RNA-binding Zn ribbon-like protein